MVVTAWDAAREHRWLLRRLGLDEVAKKVKVELAPVPGSAVGVFYPDKKLVKLEEYYPEYLVHELVHAAGLGEWAAYYADERARDVLYKAYKVLKSIAKEDDYRNSVRRAYRKQIERLTRGIATYTLPVPAITLTDSEVLTGLYGAFISLFSFLSHRRLSVYHKPHEVRYLRWLFKRGIKKGLKMDVKDARRFTQGREEVLGLREMLPPRMLSEGRLKALRVHELWSLLPYYGEKEKEILWKVFLDKYEKLPEKEKLKLLTSFLPKIPGWFLKPSSYK